MHELRITRLEVENFKSFSSKVDVSLEHPAILIGPNNAGKTTVVQALSLWSRAIREWHDKKGSSSRHESKERFSAGLNRLELFEIPVTDTRFLWHDGKVVSKNKPIEFRISVSLVYQGKEQACRMIFTRRDSEVIYAKPCPDTLPNLDLIAFASTIDVSLLYPMSGLEMEETLLPLGRIKVLMGQGRTAEVLRNLCYLICQKDDESAVKNWERIAELMNRMFLVSLNKPIFNAARGNIVLTYRQRGVEGELDVSMSGRGMLQMLLVLAHLYGNPRSILMVDEPDAHLEILRQRQAFTILQRVAEETGSQVIIATHSEVILNDAVDSSLTLLLQGKSIPFSEKKAIIGSLKDFGVDHYFRAESEKRILYLEGRTDLLCLQNLAKLLDHPAQAILEDKLNTYFIQNNDPEPTLESHIDQLGGQSQDYRRNFQILRQWVPGLVGVALLDGDGRGKNSGVQDGLTTLYWKAYEIENTFLNLDLLYRYVDQEFDGNLFADVTRTTLSEVAETLLLERVFDGDKATFSEYRSSSSALKRQFLSKHKMSSLIEEILEKVALESKSPILMRKGGFHRLIFLAKPQEIAPEVTEKLDALVRIFQGEPTP